jgi:hypothetical protein
MTDDHSNKPQAEWVRSRGGGNATAAGVSFQASVGAMFSSQLLTERSIDVRLKLGNVTARAIRFETEAPVDDILIETSGGGWIFVQAKTSITLSENVQSEFGKVASQLVRLWLACTEGTGSRRWDRPLDATRDRILIAVGAQTAATVSGSLASALDALRASSASPMTQSQTRAVGRFDNALLAAWQTLLGREPMASEIGPLRKLVSVISYDFEGADRAAATEMLRSVVVDTNNVNAAFDVLTNECTKLMTLRQGATAIDIRRSVEQVGIKLKAAPSFQSDIEKLATYSERVEAHLRQYEETVVSNVRVNIERKCVDALIEAARKDSLLLVGEPGAGKSAVVSAAAQRLRNDGAQVIELAVDRLPVESLDGLRVELGGLSNPLRDVLDNWPGSDPAFLFIDALDATRGGKSEAVFRMLISDVLALPSKRWRIVASIRSFDLRLGEQYRNLFKGVPPDPKFSDASFSRVRHLHVPRWTIDELAELLSKAPELEVAIRRGGERMRELALVPFNTRLLADLISDGVAPGAFGDVSSQVELLSLYWERRVAQLGAGAELCLRSVVDEMVALKVLRAGKLTSAEPDPTAFNQLLKENVLILVGTGRYVSFRHHILFDYAASRVFIDPSNIASTGALLQKDPGLGLMLAPALAFALQELWLQDDSRHGEFWRAVFVLAGGDVSEPIARSVAARVACELPIVREDVEELAESLPSSSVSHSFALRAFTHVVGALSIRLEDKQPVKLMPWCFLASEASAQVGLVAWSLRALLYQVVDRATTEAERALVGRASRAMLNYGLGNEEISAHFVSSAIGFVAKTYASNPSEARQQLERLLTNERLRDHAHEDMPWLTEEIQAIGAVDPWFVVAIYKTVFGYRVTDTSATSMGGSQILPLTSHKSQDYEMARWKLKEDFPRFLRECASPAIHSLVAALDANVTNERRIGETLVEHLIDGGTQTGRLVDDYSHVWAWNTDDSHADNIEELVKAFVSRLNDADESEALALISEVIKCNRMALLWSRMFMVGAKRPVEIGKFLWSYATKGPLLRSDDTRKDAIDLIAATYDFVPAALRRKFEQEIIELKFDDAVDAILERQRVLGSVFAAVGLPRLVSSEARDALKAMPVAYQSRPNDRPYHVSVSTEPVGPLWWLESEGVDVHAPLNAALLKQIEDTSAHFKPGDSSAETQEFSVSVRELVELWQHAHGTASKDLAAKVIDYADDTIARACDTLARRVTEIDAESASFAELCDLVATLLDHHSPMPPADREGKSEASTSSFAGVRTNAVEAALLLCRASPQAVSKLMAKIRSLQRDPNPSVRLTIAGNLALLWNAARVDMWLMARAIAQTETNRGVLRFFAGFLMRVVHADPARTEQLTLEILHYSDGEGDTSSENLARSLGKLIALLWVSHERKGAREVLDGWLLDAAKHEQELGGSLSAVRDGLVLGYASGENKDVSIRRRCQALAAQVVETTASNLEEFLQQPAAKQTELAARGKAFAKLLDQASNEFYYSSGALKNQDNQAQLASLEWKREFLRENAKTFFRVGQAGTPHTIYYLLELLQFLTPADPGTVFDLASNALLSAGRKHGFQFESLGANRFVALIGLFLADHRDLFVDEGRRKTLVECLDAFVEAGWPSARRLLYRLPDLIQ